MIIIKIIVLILGLFLMQSIAYAKDNLSMPRCGYFAPSQEFNNNPSIYWSLLLGSAGQPFEIPYLAGCRQPQFEMTLPSSKYLQQYNFLYNNLDFIRGGHHTLKNSRGNIEQYSVFNIEYYPNQLVKRFSQLCSLGVGEELLDFVYDDQDRLLMYYHRRPANCYEQSSPLYKSQSFEYAIKELKQMPSGGKINYRFPKAEQIQFHIEYDYDSLNRIVEKREHHSNGSLIKQSVIYDKAGNITEKTIYQSKKNQFVDKKIYKYQYDNTGRLTQIKLSNQQKVWGFNYFLNGNIKTFVVPNPNFVPVGENPYHLRFDF